MIRQSSAVASPLSMVFASMPTAAMAIVLIVVMATTGGTTFFAEALTARASSTPPSSPHSSPPSRPRRHLSIVTGAGGYLGREIVHTLLSTPIRTTKGKGDATEDDIGGDSGSGHLDDHGSPRHEIICLVRPSKVKSEEEYWTRFCGERPSAPPPPSPIADGDKAGGAFLRVLPYDMLDGGVTLRDALESSSPSSSSLSPGMSPSSTTVYHVASVFGPTEDHEQTALDNVRGTEDAVRTLSAFFDRKGGDGDDDAPCRPRLVFTSSMAAVRGTGQTPSNGSFYTHRDWNVVSKLGENWGQSYQWSKTQSERRAGELSEEFGNVVDVTSLCPSFVFGPVREGTPSSSSSFSIELVRQWLSGESPVQSRLCVDVRDAALAHVAAASSPGAAGRRYVVSSEVRLDSGETAHALRRVAAAHVGAKTTAGDGDCDPDRIHRDEDFDGGAIRIGDREVESLDRLWNDLGVACRPVEETMADMARSLLLSC